MKWDWSKFATWGGWLVLLVPVAIGLGVVVFAVAMKRTPEQAEVQEVARPLSVTTIQRRDIRPRVTGYGLAQPSRTWRAIARVDGAIIETHPRLKAGAILNAGEVLVKIDPTDYELMIDRLTAEADALRAQIDETKRQRDNDEAVLALEQNSLKLVKNELARAQQAYRQNSVSRSTLDTATRDVVMQQRSVQTLENSLNLVPAKLERLSANVRVIEKQLATARRDLERTTITAPFDCRLASVEIEPGQYVSPNERLFEVHGLDRIEVEARIPIDDLERLAGVGEAVYQPNDWPSADDSATDAKPNAPRGTIVDLVRGLNATVRVSSGDWTRTWPARVMRVREQVDRRTRSVGVVVEVEESAGNNNPAAPPILEDTFCEVVLSGRVREGQLLVPIAAVRDGQVYVIDAEDRLERRPVMFRMMFEGQAIVTGNVSAGERIVVADPTPAVEGMLVDPIMIDEREQVVSESSAPDMRTQKGNRLVTQSEGNSS